MKTGCHCLKLAGAAMALYLLIAAAPAFSFSDATKSSYSPSSRDTGRVCGLGRLQSLSRGPLQQTVRAHGTLQDHVTGGTRLRILSRARRRKCRA